MAKAKGIPEPAASHLLAQAEKLFNSSERRNFELLWEDLSKYLLPQQHRDFSVNSVQNKGEKLTSHIYDSTGVRACSELAAIMHSILTPPALRWTKLQFSEEKDRKDKEATEWLDRSVSKMHEIINSSNFSQEFSASYKTYVGLGNACGIIEDGDTKEGGEFSGINVTSWHLSSVVFVENQFGTVDTVYRKVKISGIKAIERWGNKLPEDILKKYEEDPFHECEYLHVIMPRNKMNVKRLSTGKYVKGAEPYANLYIAKESQAVVENSGFMEFPCYIFRADKSEGETYARGPGSIALPDIKTLNALVLSDLESAALAANPPVIVEQRNIIGDINIKPKALIVVKSADGIKEFITGARFEINDKRIDRLTSVIRAAFYLDKLVIPPRETRGEMTAYEIAQLRVDMQRIMGPLSDRIQAETIGPSAKRIFNLCLRGGKFDPIPKSVRGKRIKIEYVNPISRTQNAEDLTSISQWLQTAMTLAQMGKPEALDVISTDKLMGHNAKVLNVPEEVKSSEEEITNTRKQRAEMQQQLMQQESAVKQADVNAKNAKANPQQPNEGEAGLA